MCQTVRHGFGSPVGSLLGVVQRPAERSWEANQVAISLDPAASPGTVEEATAVVDAVLAALPADESDWIEWKSSLDLGDKAVRGTLARHILGLANRPPQEAAAHAGGRGFVVVGAEPGNRPGVRAADPADLSQGINAFLGPERPSWALHYDGREGLLVLVLTVAPPRPGDPAFTLFKDLQVMSPGGKRKDYPRGTIFVRHLGRTEIARPEDVRALLERFARPLREADTAARESAEIARARHKAEELDRRRRMLLDTLSLVNEIFSKAYRVNNPGRWRCKEQLDLHGQLIAMNLDLPDCRTLAGAGQGNEAVAWAVKARDEVEAELRKLATGT
jgi:hypothetical protein